MTIPKIVTKHDIGRRYTKIVRKILRLSEKLVVAEKWLEYHRHHPNRLRLSESEQEVELVRANLESYVRQSLKEFQELVEASTLHCGRQEVEVIEPMIGPKLRAPDYIRPTGSMRDYITPWKLYEVIKGIKDNSCVLIEDDDGDVIVVDIQNHPRNDHIRGCHRWELLNKYEESA